MPDLKSRVGSRVTAMACMDSALAVFWGRFRAEGRNAADRRFTRRGSVGGTDCSVASISNHMSPPVTKNNAATALVGIWTVALTAFVISTLFFAREILIPLALSALLTFLLSPLVTTIERWVGRIAAVLVVVALIFAVTGAAGWMLTRQLVDLATKLPEYKGNIVAKLHAFRIPTGGAFTRLSAAVDDLKKELPGGSAAVDLPTTQDAGRPDNATASTPNIPVAVPVHVVETSQSKPMEMIRMIAAPILGPLGTAALVLLLVICMLFQ